jgi:hypothetical protein
MALLKAAKDLFVDGRGATLAELAERACVGRDAARTHLPKLKSRGHMQIIGSRRVDYRNRPVAEYAPVDPDAPVIGEGWVNLGNCLSGWAR